MFNFFDSMISALLLYKPFTIYGLLNQTNKQILGSPNLLQTNKQLLGSTTLLQLDKQTSCWNPLPFFKQTNKFLGSQPSWDKQIFARIPFPSSTQTKNCWDLLPYPSLNKQTIFGNPLPFFKQTNKFLGSQPSWDKQIFARIPFPSSTQTKNCWDLLPYPS